MTNFKSPPFLPPPKKQNPRCAEPGCIKRPRYGEEGERARFCAAHKFDHMVDMASRRGSSSKCTTSTSPSKRPRDGPRSVAHDTAAGAAASASSRRSGAASGGVPVTFCLSAEDAEEPPRKRGHTVSAAGGHRVSSFAPLMFVVSSTCQRVGWPYALFRRANYE